MAHNYLCFPRPRRKPRHRTTETLTKLLVFSTLRMRLFFYKRCRISIASLRCSRVRRGTERSSLLSQQFLVSLGQSFCFPAYCASFYQDACATDLLVILLKHIPCLSSRKVTIALTWKEDMNASRKFCISTRSHDMASGAKGSQNGFSIRSYRKAFQIDEPSLVLSLPS